MEDSDEDELLNLTLSVSTTDRERKNKGKKIIIRETNSSNITCSMSSTIPPPPNHHHHHHNHNTYMMMNSTYDDNNLEQGYEGKIFRLLQMRDQMLRQDHRRNKGVVIVEDGNNGLPLIHLLLRTATLFDDNNNNNNNSNSFGSVLENLTSLYQVVSLRGDSVERVVAYFADGLAARLLTRNSPFYNMLMEEQTSEEDFLAFTDLYRVSPYYQFAHFTANQAILEVFEKEEHTNNHALHVIDFDVSYGFQWPSLIQSLSEKATSGNRISLRVTGFGNNMKELQETESRLVSFSKGFGNNNLVFEFQGLLRGSSSSSSSRVIINQLRKKKNETVAVNLVSYLNTLSCFMKISDTLGFVHSLKPSIVVLVEQEGSRSGNRSFISRFTDTLHYFAAMFDSLDDCLPMDSSERLRIEKKLLGKEIKSMINYYDNNNEIEGGGDVDYYNNNNSNNNNNKNYYYYSPKYERMETWKARMENHGFCGNKISSKSIIQAKLLLKMRTHYCSPHQFEEEVAGGGFRVCERDDGKAISLGWQNRFLLTVSAWQPI